MEKDPFVILGVADSVTQNELYEAYRSARRQWEGLRFRPGEEGAEACEKLDELDEAYRAADDIIKSRYYVANYDNRFQEADELCKEKRYDEAQRILDAATDRSAEWHFLQSVIYYAKKRTSDALFHLQTAVQMEPTNEKYTSALHNMEGKMNESADGQARQPRDSFYNYRDDSGRSYRNGYEGGRGMGNCTPCDCCSSLICADCCCECMGGDLISCC